MTVTTGFAVKVNKLILYIITVTLFVTRNHKKFFFLKKERYTDSPLIKIGRVNE